MYLLLTNIITTIFRRLKGYNSLPLSLNPPLHPFDRIARFTPSSVLEITIAVVTKSLQNLP